MAKILFSKKQFRATIGRKSSAFGKIMGNKNIARVVNTAKERREFYGALRDQALRKGSVGMRKSDLKRVLGKLEKSKSLSNHERHVIGKELVGGSASSRVIRDSGSADKSTPGKPEVNMRETMQEIVEKGKSGIPADVQKNNNLASAPSKVLNFGVSAKNLRNAQQLFVQTDDDYPMQNYSSSVAEYIANHQDSGNDVDSIKTVLERIQAKPEAQEDKKPPLTQKYPETLSTIDQSKIEDSKKGNLTKEEAKSMLARIQEKPEVQEDKKTLLTQKYPETLSQKIIEQSHDEVAGLQSEEKISKEKPAKKDDPVKIDGKNISQIIKIGQEKIRAMSLAGQESNPDYQKLIALLMKNQDGKNVWKSAEEIDIAGIEADIESIIEKNSKEEEKSADDSNKNNKPESANTEQVRVEDEKTDLTA
jgi:hypothetical protein